MPVIAPTGQLRRLGQQLRSLKGPFQAELKRQLTEESRTQLAYEFERARNPYGEDWTPLKRRSGIPLSDTGRLKNSFQARPTAAGFVVTTNVKYAGVHQYGARIRWKGGSITVIPRRQFMPEKKLGPIWEKAFVDIANATMKDFMERR